MYLIDIVIDMTQYQYKQDYYKDSVEKSQSKSRFTVKFHEQSGRVAIVDKNTGEAIETYADNIPESLLVQRMHEIREDELFRDKLTAGTSLENGGSGIFVPGQQNIQTGDIIV